MENKFTRKVIRSFMENCMKNQLIFKSTFSLSDLISLYHDDLDEICSYSPDDNIDFINALMEYLWPNFCKKYISDGVRVMEFFLDPCDSIAWDKAMNKIYNRLETNQPINENYVVKVHGNLVV